MSYFFSHGEVWFGDKLSNYCYFEVTVLGRGQMVENVFPRSRPTPRAKFVFDSSQVEI